MKTTHERIPEVLDVLPAREGAPAQRRPRRCRAASRSSWRSARALLLRPKVILIDEPSIGLSPIVVQDVFKLLRSLADRAPRC